MRNAPKSETPVRIAISGIDGTGKTEALSRVATRLHGRGLSVLRPRRPACVMPKGEAPRDLLKRPYGVFEQLHRLADESESRALVGGVCTTYNMLAGVVEDLATRRFHPDVVMLDRAAQLDGPVYGDYYLPGSKRLPKGAKRRLVQAVSRTDDPDLIVYFDIDVDIALSRIQARIEEQDRANRWQHMHENREDLRQLQEGFERIIETMPDGHVVRVQANQTRDAVAQELQGIVEGLLEERGVI